MKQIAAFGLEERLTAHAISVGVIGLGYVGLPLARAFWQAGLNVIGFDTDAAKVAKLIAAESYIAHFAATTLGEMNASRRFHATTDFSMLRDADAVLICVPTPLTRTRDPDLQFVEATCETISKFLRPAQLVVLESTTYPGTTTEVVQPILEQNGLRCGQDFFLAFSPEREDPGSMIDTKTIPKIVGGADDRSGRLAVRLYERAFDRVHLVADAKTAEAVKITENVFRAVNIALVNELKIAYAKMGVNVWDVIDAAKTKPFGYMPFYPGPGLGGHCIPIDPFYLSWRARAFGVDTKFIELAGEINRAMPALVVQVLQEALSSRFRRSLSGAAILILGVAYKKNVDDLRESPSLVMFEILQRLGATVSYHDPYFAQIPKTREHAKLAGNRSISLDQSTVAKFDAALVATDHDSIDYSAIVGWSRLVVDTRNATRNVAIGREKIVLA